MVILASTNALSGEWRALGSDRLYDWNQNVAATGGLSGARSWWQFPDLLPLENFDWQFNPQINRAQTFQLATAQFVRERRDMLLVCSPSTWGAQYCHRLRGAQGRLPGALLLGLRTGAGAPILPNLGRRPAEAGPVLEARPAVPG